MITNQKNIGKITTTYGNKGQLLLRLSPYFEPNFQNYPVESIFISQKYTKKFFIENFQKKNQKIILTLKEINSLEEAYRLINYEVFIDEDLYNQNNKQKDIINFSFIHETEGYWGIINDIILNSANPLVSIKQKNGNEFLIPFNEENIKNIDYQKKEVTGNPLTELKELN